MIGIRQNMAVIVWTIKPNHEYRVNHSDFCSEFQRLADIFAVLFFKRKPHSNHIEYSWKLLLANYSFLNDLKQLKFNNPIVWKQWRRFQKEWQQENRKLAGYKRKTFRHRIVSGNDKLIYFSNPKQKDSHISPEKINPKTKSIWIPWLGLGLRFFLVDLDYSNYHLFSSKDVAPTGQRFES